ncbi:MAG: hypothetical protein ACTSU9_08890 [Promethearchaeota archaeon]
MFYEKTGIPSRWIAITLIKTMTIYYLITATFPKDCLEASTIHARGKMSRGSTAEAFITG